MLETLNQYDHSLMLWLNYDGGAFLDAFWYAVSYKFSWVPLYVAILWVFVSHARHRSLTMPSDGPSRSTARILIGLLITTALIIVAADQLSSGLIKPLVQRPRPSHEPGLEALLHYVGDYRGGRYGFVSSHAANTAALALWLCLLFRQRALWCAMAAFYVANCYSRIYLGVHYPGDIICGTLIGLLAAFVGYTVFRRCVASPDERASDKALLGDTSARPVVLTFWASVVIMLGYAVI